MTETLQALGRQLGADVDTLSSISRNVANIQTPGYRAERMTADFATQAGLMPALDQRDGSLAQTGRGLDLALRGPGFFVVERQGQALLVRSGSFQIDADGNLVTRHGDRVLGQSGALTLDPALITADAPMRVEADGQLWAGSQPLGQLQIVAVEQPLQLRAMGNGAYRYDGAPAQWQGSVVQGAVEGANVDPADEMLRLMELTRHVDAVRRAMSTYDQMLDAGINRIGEN
ncbi:flagellar hook-basal body protein [Stenotrophomonas sp. SPM]|uniref:flagellar hook-basal body protein n=1 Tax=Stenotrophomonas sp. SPM TaxID=2170735 RepID=UPI000DE6C257|nr:flagellar hook basal-body protein [Stenotrophomonas sp. SPM]PWB29849.1 flagellar hook-basal body protein [Stenotrophomonas sp. SPM]